MPAGAPARRNFFLRHREQPFTLGLLAFKLAYSADGFAALPRRSHRGLFVKTFALHFAEQPLPLHSLFQNFKGLIDVVVANVYLQNIFPSASRAAAMSRHEHRGRTPDFSAGRTTWRLGYAYGVSTAK